MSMFNKKKKRLTFQTVGCSALHCCVPMCTGSSRYNLQISFHNFPSKNSLCEQWLTNIRRDFTPSKGNRVCSRHFLPGDIVQTVPGGLRRLRNGAVPVLFHWNSYSLLKAAADPEDRAGVPDHNYSVSHMTRTEQSSTSEPVEVLQSRAEPLLLGSRVALERYAGADSDVHYYTRFASYQHFQHFWRLIEPAVKTKMTSREVSATGSVSFHHSTKLLLIDELFMFLMYLSVGLPPQDLAARFGIPGSAVSRIISTWTHFLYQLLGGTCLWLPRKFVRSLLPPEFEAFSDTHVVLDCMEICCQTPADPHTEVCSTYKSHSTLKALVGMAPHGAVTFVSPLYAGSMSDCEIFKQSGISSVLQSDMAIMVHSGFLIDDVAPCRVHRPAYLSEQTQSPQQVQHTQSVVRLRVHMERCLRRLKEYGLFDRTTPAPACASIGELFHVACYLLNYQSGPLVKQ